MTTFGKVLILLNVIAAAAVAYFATDNWAKRQSMNATGLRYAVTVHGLPTEPQAGQPAALSSAPADDDSVAVRLATGTARYTDDVPYRLLKAHFTGADGKTDTFGSNLPPLSVVGELQRVKSAVDTYMAVKLTTDEARLAWLCGVVAPNGNYTPGILTLLADGFGERQVIKRLLYFPNVAVGGRAAEVAANLTKARAMLQKRWDAVLNTPNPKLADEDAKALDEAQKAVTTASNALTLANQQEVQTRLDLKDAPEAPAKTDQLTRASLITQDARNKLSAAFDELERVMASNGLAYSRDNEDRRRQALLLLAHLDPNDASWQKRMMLLFGLPEYAQAQLDRIEKLKPYPGLYDDERLAADARFFAEYEQLKQAARDRDRILDRQLELLAEAQAQVADARKLLTERATYRDERVAIAKNLSEQLATLAAEQEVVEAKLFEIQTRVGRLLRDNFALEDRLVIAERQALPPTGR